MNRLMFAFAGMIALFPLSPALADIPPHTFRETDLGRRLVQLAADPSLWAMVAVVVAGAGLLRFVRRNRK